MNLKQRAEKLQLTRAQAHVLYAMCEFADAGGGACFATVLEIAVKAHYCERTTQRAMKELEEAGHIIAVANARGGRGNTTEYRIEIDNPVPSVGVKTSRLQK